MILRGRLVAFMLGVLGAGRQLLRTLAGFRLRAVARGGLLPVLDLLLQCRLGRVVARSSEGELGVLGGGLDHGAADAFGLEERPQVRRLDVLADGFGLGALAERLRQREKQGDHGDQQRDLLVGAGSVLGVLRMLHAFVGAHGLPPGEWPWSGTTIDRTIWPAQGAMAFSSEACRAPG